MRISPTPVRSFFLAIAISAFCSVAADAQTHCGSDSRAIAVNAANATLAPVMERPVSLYGRGVSLREALDRLAAAARVRLSYTADQLQLSRSVCLEYKSVPVSRVLADLLVGAKVQPVVVGGDQIVLTPAATAFSLPAAPAPVFKQVGQLDRVVVTGSATGGSQRSLAVALDVVSGEQLAERGAGSLSGSLDGVVPGLWLWEQSPLSLVARYGSIRGASSFGVSYPKVYVDGIEVANSLLVTHLDTESIARIEVIRGPQGAALYGADAISGVMNIVTRQDGTEGGASTAQLNTKGGASSSDYSVASVLTQNHSASLRYGTGLRSARLGLNVARIGAFIPDASSQQIMAHGSARLVSSRSILTGTFRLFAQDADTPSSPILAGLDLWTPSPVPGPAPTRDYGEASAPNGRARRGELGPPTMHRLDSLSRLVISDSSDRQSVRQFTVGGNAMFTQNDRWTHSVTVGIDGYRLRSAAVLDGAFPSAIDSALRTATGNATRATLRGSTVGEFGGEEHAFATLTLAAEHSVVRDETNTHGLFAPARSGPRYSRQSFVENRSNTGVIAQANAGFRSALFMNGGLRVERNSGLGDVSDIAVLPMLGVSAIRTFGIATLKLRSAYGKGIRPVQTSSRAGTLLGLRGPSAGATLSPEEQSGIEFGVDAFIGSHLTLHVTRFDQRASGLIQPVSVYFLPIAADSQPQYRRISYELQNVGEITNRGWEFQGALDAGPWSVGATFSQVDSRVAKLAARYSGDLRPADRMLEVPSRTIGLNGSYRHGRWYTSGSVARASNWINYDRVALLSDFANQNRDAREFVGSELRSYWKAYDGVTRLGGRFGFSVSRGVTFTVDGENLLDEQTGEPDNVTVLPGRTLSAGLRVSF